MYISTQMPEMLIVASIKDGGGGVSHRCCSGSCFAAVPSTRVRFIGAGGLTFRLETLASGLVGDRIQR